MKTAFEESAKKQTTSSDRLWGRSVVYGKEDEHATPYMTRYWIGRLRLHIFYRGDQDPDCHDHPWDFWTFPLTAYVEEVANPDLAFLGREQTVVFLADEKNPACSRNVVPAWRLSFRPAEHCHRVLGKWYGKHTDSGPGRVVTIVWRSGKKRPWGFLKHRDGRWCWIAWREYVFGGGKHAPCE